MCARCQSVFLLLFPLSFVGGTVGTVVAVVLRCSSRLCGIALMKNYRSIKVDAAIFFFRVLTLLVVCAVRAMAGYAQNADQVPLER